MRKASPNSEKQKRKPKNRPTPIPRIHAVLGATGSGKSTLARKLLESFPRSFVILPSEDTVFAGYGEIAPTLGDVARLSSQPTFRIIFISEHQLAFEFICYLAWERGNCAVFIDELHHFVSNAHTAIPQVFKRLVLRGRHQNITVIAASQRPANVHNDFLSEAASHQLHVFKLGFPADLDALKKIIPDVYRVQNFKVGEKISWPPLDTDSSAGRSLTVESEA